MNGGETDSPRAVGQSSQRPFLYHDGNGDDRSANDDNGDNDDNVMMAMAMMTMVMMAMVTIRMAIRIKKITYVLCHDGNGNISMNQCNHSACSC